MISPLPTPIPFQGLPELNGTADISSIADYKYVPPSDVEVSVPGTEIIGGIVICLLVGIALALGYVKLCLMWGESLIHTSTRCMIAIYFIFGVLFAMSGYMGGAILCLICGAITCCWYGCVQRHIPFAGQVHNRGAKRRGCVLDRVNDGGLFLISFIPFFSRAFHSSLLTRHSPPPPRTWRSRATPRRSSPPSSWSPSGRCS